MRASSRPRIGRFEEQDVRGPFAGAGEVASPDARGADLRDGPQDARARPPAHPPAGDHGPRGRGRSRRRRRGRHAVEGRGPRRARASRGPAGAARTATADARTSALRATRIGRGAPSPSTSGFRRASSAVEPPSHSRGRSTTRSRPSSIRSPRSSTAGTACARRRGRCSCTAPERSRSSGRPSRGGTVSKSSWPAGARSARTWPRATARGSWT